MLNEELVREDEMTARNWLRKPCVRIFSGGLLTLSLCMIYTTVSAQDRVVVIPLVGDDVPGELTPSAPVSKIEPSSSDYTYSFLSIPLNTVFDKTTGLLWQRQDDSVERDWDDAWNYCASLTIVDNLVLVSRTYNNWRLPTVTELISIASYGDVVPGVIAPPVIVEIAFPDTKKAGYWSASASARSTALAWEVDFDFGGFNETDKGNLRNVRCVR